MLSDPIATVRASAVRCLDAMFHTVRTVPPSEVKLFPEYILPTLHQLSTSEKEEIVLLSLASSLASFASIRASFIWKSLPADEQLGAIDWLAGQGVSRILTHGGPAGTPIEDNLGRLRAYVDRAAGRVTILPGGGITWENAERIASELGVCEVHGTKIVRLA